MTDDINSDNTNSDANNGDDNDAMIETDDGRGRRTVLLIVAIVIAVIVAVGLVLALSSDDDDDTSTTSAPSSAVSTVPTTLPESTLPGTTAPATTAPATTAPATTAPATTAPATTTPVTTAPTTPTTLPAGDVSSAVWPDPDTDTRYDDPVEAARAFATDLVGFTDPVLGEFRPGQPRSGEVDLQGSDAGPVTTVALRQLSDDESWWVVGASTVNIVVDEPAQLATIASPVHISGGARAFEGTVNVILRADGTDDPVFDGFVTVTGFEGLGPFEADIEFDTPDADAGVLLLLTYSSDDDSVVEVTTVRVFFAAA